MERERRPIDPHRRPGGSRSAMAPEWRRRAVGERDPKSRHPRVRPEGGSVSWTETHIISASPAPPLPLPQAADRTTGSSIDPLLLNIMISSWLRLRSSPHPPLGATQPAIGSAVCCHTPVSRRSARHPSGPQHGAERAGGGPVGGVALAESAGPAPVLRLTWADSQHEAGGEDGARRSRRARSIGLAARSPPPPAPTSSPPQQRRSHLQNNAAGVARAGAGGGPAAPQQPQNPRRFACCIDCLEQ